MPSDNSRVFTVVLTGGIASGKTVVSDHFSRLGVPVIDTDIIARELVVPGKPALRSIAREFGPEYLEESGDLNRRRLREAIFADSTLRSRLESILHPLIAAEARRQVKQVKYPYCILVIPLYAESERWSWIDRVLVVDSLESAQVERVMARDRISRKQAEAILAAQLSRQERLALADDVIENTSDLKALHAQVDSLHKQYLMAADLHRGLETAGANQTNRPEMQ